MPLEGLTRDYTTFNFLNDIDPIFDISFRLIGHLVFIPDGQEDSYLVSPSSQKGKAWTFNDPDDVSDVLESGTFAFKQHKALFRHHIPEGSVVFPYQLPASPTKTDINDGFQAFFDSVETNPGIGWPYLLVSNIGNSDVAGFDALDWLSEASSFAAAQENILILRYPRDLYGDLTTFATKAKDLAESLNSERTVLTAHDGDDTDGDNQPDEEAALDALVAGFIGSLPVGGWNITLKDVPGLESARFNGTQINLLHNGAPGNSAVITAADAFLEPSFSINHSTGGNFIDIPQVRDFLRFKWRQAFTLRQKNNNKIAYSYHGLRKMANVLEEPLLNNVENPQFNTGIVRLLVDNTPDMDVFVPKIADIPLADRVNRIARPYRVRFGYTGAIDSIEADVLMEV